MKQLDAEPAAGARTLVVTGGSRGIGAAVAKLAAQRKYAVAVNYAVNEVAARRVVDEIRGAGGTATAIRGDVAVDTDVIALFAEAERTLGPIAALVNNAGITGGLSRVENVSADMLQRLLAVNIIGTFLCAREAIRRMSTRLGGQGGAIVNLSSRASAIGGGGDWVHYAASKGAVDTFTLGLAREVGSEGIRVNAVSPGLIETEIHAAAGDPGRVQRLLAGVPLQRTGTAEEVAETILWLLSNAASYVTGAVLDVGGGR
ncbi:MAG: SDR family oxidoreductase [Candidatus Velthaea sp.]